MGVLFRRMSNAPHPGCRGISEGNCQVFSRETEASRALRASAGVSLRRDGTAGGGFVKRLSRDDCWYLVGAEAGRTGRTRGTGRTGQSIPPGRKPKEPHKHFPARASVSCSSVVEPFDELPTSTLRVEDRSGIECPTSNVTFFRSNIPYVVCSAQWR